MDDDVGALDGARLDAPRLDPVFAIQDQDRGPLLVDLQGALGDDQGILGLLLRQHDTQVLAIDQQTAWIGEHRPHQQGVGARVRGHVHVIQSSELVIARAIRQLGPSDNGMGIAPFGRDPPLFLKEFPLADGKEDIGGVLAHQGGQNAGGGTNEIADGQACPADPSGYRGLDLGIVQVKLGRGQGGLGLFDAGLRHPMGGPQLVYLRGGHVLLPQQFLAAGILGLGILHLGQGLAEIRLTLSDDGLVLIRLDDEQDLSRRHLITLRVAPLLEEALDPGAQFHLVHRRHPTDEGDLLLDRLKGRSDHLNAGGDGLAARGWGLIRVAAGNQDRRQGGKVQPAERGAMGGEGHARLRHGQGQRLFLIVACRQDLCHFSSNYKSYLAGAIFRDQRASFRLPPPSSRIPLSSPPRKPQCRCQKKKPAWSKSLCNA